MKSKHIFLIICSIFLSSDISWAQLSGYFTVGGSGADYPSVSMALSDMQDQGISGPVTIGINSGEYNGFIIDPISGASTDNRITIESVSLDSTDVVILGKVDLDEAHFFTINAITIETENTLALKCFKTQEFLIKNCIINSNYDGGGGYDGAIKVRHYNSGSATSKVNIENCAINTLETAITVSLMHGRTMIKNCTIVSVNDYAINGSSLTYIKIENNNIVGDVDISTWQHSHLKWNTIVGEIEIRGLSSVIGNSIESDDMITIDSDYFEDNYIKGPILYIRSESSQIYNNYFDVIVRVNFAYNSVVIGNHIMKGFGLSFNKALRLENNYIYGDFLYGDTYIYNDQYYIHNNIFTNCNLDARGHNSTISYNTFVDSAYLYAYYGDIKVYDNLFSLPSSGEEINENILNNNYYPFANSGDSMSYNYNPHFTDDAIATNPLLQGKSRSESPEYDILGNMRRIPSAIGANEIFICSDNSNNEITVPCGEEVYLNMCNLPDSGEFWWEPSECVDDPDSSYTMVNVCEDNMTLYLFNSEFGLIDSVIIHTEEFIVEVAEMPIFYCDYPRRITASNHPNASYHWTPEYGLSDPYSRTPILNVDDTDYLEYVIECEIEGCGTSYDTLYIDFDSIPYPQLYYPEQIHDTIFFNCVSRCADEYLWDFGDGSTSTEEDPFHIYQGNGTYNITLTVYNEYGSRSGTLDYNYYWLKESDIEIDVQNIQIFPNPANNILTVKGLNLEKNTAVRIFELSGDLAYSSPIINEEMSVDTHDFTQGIYIVHIVSGNLSILKKVLIVH